MASGGHGNAAGSQSGVQRVGGSVSSQLDDQRRVNKVAGNEPRVHIWEAAGDKNPMAEAMFPHMDFNQLVDGVGRIWKVINPAVALESSLPDDADVFLPPRFLGNDELPPHISWLWIR